MRALIRIRTARLAALARTVLRDGHERGDVTGWAALAGLATVGAVTMVAKYHELLVQAMLAAAEVPLGGLPGH